MSSTLEFTQYVAGQLCELDGISYKKLFGEYGLWYAGKFFGTVENNQLYIKVTQAGRTILGHPAEHSPHEGSHMFLIEELEDKNFLIALVTATCAELPMPKPKKKKQIK